MSGLSVIISTYNKPAFLEKALRGFTIQTLRDFEIVVADDGSGPETADLIQRVRRESGMTILHVWHGDRGFRKSEILNRAIVASHGDYLVFTDGDCIPRRDLIAVHRLLARPRSYVAGGYLKLPASITSEVTIDDIDSGRVTDLPWLKSRGWKPGRRALRLARSRTLARLFDALTPTSPDFQGNNASTWREALFEVNGFEGEMGYGGLDQALGYRLENAGITGIQARHRAITMHLHHDRPYRDPEVVRQNRKIKKRIRASRETRARNGLAELRPDPSLKIEG